MRLNELRDRAHTASLKAGFWDDTFTLEEAVGPDLLQTLHAAISGQKVALIHSEVSEALEANRAGEPPLHIDPDTGKPEGELSELADVIIRIADFAGWKGYDLEHAVTRKLAYNSTRPHKHGKTF